MRSLLLLSSLVVLGACADDSRPTAAASRSTSTNDVRSASLPVAQGKPADAVGFTKVTLVIATWSLAANGQSQYVQAACPAGTTAIGGGYELGFAGQTALPPSVLAASPVGNAWGMTFVNNQPGAIAWQVKIAATCAS